MDGQKTQLGIENDCDHSVSKKWKPWKEWKQGNASKEKYLERKKKARKVVYQTSCYLKR